RQPEASRLLIVLPRSKPADARKFTEGSSMLDPYRLIRLSQSAAAGTVPKTQSRYSQYQVRSRHPLSKNSPKRAPALESASRNNCYPNTPTTGKSAKIPRPPGRTRSTATLRFCDTSDTQKAPPARSEDLQAFLDHHFIEQVHLLFPERKG